MRKVATWGVALLLITALATPALAQATRPDPKWKPEYKNEDYNGFMAIWNEKDNAKKAANAEKFITTFKEADPIAIEDAYMMMLRAYYAAQAWPKVVETADKQATVAPALPANDKKTVLLMGMDASSRIPNNAKIKEYANKVLAGEPTNFGALYTLSGLLAGTLPADDAGKQKQLEETLVITRRALAITNPPGFDAATLKTIVITLRNTEAMMLLNQKKYPEAIASAEATLKLDKKNAMAWRFIGLALIPSMNEANKKYQESNKTYNDNRGAGPLIVDQLKADMDLALLALEKKVAEVHNALGRAAAAGGPGSAEARKELQGAFTGTPAELDKLIADKKAELDAN
jgi:tetratricopeptide (TPR) repeat protein